ncbi:hypothetical protein QBC46DRAFT_341051 [Diplogelasinospora grovesii]|uniref:Protein kinase domain-containing protein n=1 Tax=Diplogelasinospora grovesii TaxID=303347 RepID=A0AAN6N8Q6_9PEZI|nr:hypothetical protein QBC46DRAFT_341051 [Diplogelasinospora grovesii]
MSEYGFPEPEQNRIWHEPQVTIHFSTVAAPRAVQPSAKNLRAEAYDQPNRQWYQLNVNFKTGLLPEGLQPSQHWLSAMAEKFINEHYNFHKEPPFWNAIHTEYPEATEKNTVFELKEEYFIHGPANQRFSYGHRPSDALPITRFNEVRDKHFLARGVDYCNWQGRRCVFKRIEFDRDVDIHKNEIRARETLLNVAKSVLPPQEVEGDADYISYCSLTKVRFSTVPILAVVLHDISGGTEQKFLSARPLQDPGYDPEHRVAGFLMPYDGPSMEILAQENLDANEKKTVSIFPPVGVQLRTDSNLTVTENQLLALISSVKQLHEAGVAHGDINPQNVILPEQTGRKPLLINFGSVAPMLVVLGSAPGCQKDDIALGNLLIWCLVHSPTLRETLDGRHRVEKAAQLLKEGKKAQAMKALDYASEEGGHGSIQTPQS